MVKIRENENKTAERKSKKKGNIRMLKEVWNEQKKKANGSDISHDCAKLFEVKSKARNITKKWTKTSPTLYARMTWVNTIWKVHIAHSYAVSMC